MEHWYALYTKSRHEKRLSGFFAERGVEAYLPLVRKMKRWKDRKSEVDFPLFPGYVFIRGELEAGDAYETRMRILSAPGAVKFVGDEGPGRPPLFVPDQEILNIRTVLERKMKVDPYQYAVAIGQTVKIRKGPLAGVEGVVMERRGVFRLILHVKLIQQAVAVEIHPGDVE